MVLLSRPTTLRATRGTEDIMAADKKFDIRAEITNSIIDAMLNKQIVPWRKPWATTGVGGMPRNGSSKKPYRGVNVFHLSIVQMVKDYSSNEWFTYKQAAALGGQVRKGEKSTPVMFWKFLEDKKNPKKKIPLARFYSVFNRDQIDGLPVVEQVALTPKQKIDAAEAVIAGMPKPPTIKRDNPSDRAYYRPSTDTVVLPMLSQYEKPEEFYSTAFHELAHSTGHKSRLDRKLEDGYLNSHAYSKEELVAEMTAAFLCGETGILPATIENSTAYIVAWVKRIKEEPNLIHEAASAAQKAADHILDRKVADKPSDEEGSSEGSAEGEPVAAPSVEPAPVAVVAPAPVVTQPVLTVITSPEPAAPVVDPYEAILAAAKRRRR